MRKQAPVNRADILTIIDLNYLDRDQYIEIIRRSLPVQSNLYPIYPVFRVETIKINTKEESIIRTGTDIFGTGTQKNTQYLLYFNFTKKSTEVQEINFLVATCLINSVYMSEFPYQFYQKQVHLFSYEPGYLISTTKLVDPITISNITGSMDGSFRAYMTAAPRLESQDGSRYNVCSDELNQLNEFLFKKCLLVHQSSTRFYIYYIFKKYKSWNEASDYCKARGGFLPIVRSREEKDDVIRIFNKYGAHYPIPTFGLYLGLRLHKVCIFCN